MTEKPIIVRPTSRSGRAKLAKYRADPGVRIVRPAAVWLEDLFRINHPYIQPGSPEYKKTLRRFRHNYYDGRALEDLGVWVFLPWRQSLVHLPHEADYLKLRTARNKFLISHEEQEQFYNSRIGIAGLSVGSSIAQAIVLSGGGRQLHLADHDRLSVTNLNRLVGSVADLGEPKITILTRKLYELHPFLAIKSFKSGLHESLSSHFFGTGSKKLDLFIEEMDDLKLKIASRFWARRQRIPVLMATDNGDNTIIDVERFDQEPNRPLFHGRVSENELRAVPDRLTLTHKIRLANAIVGPDVTPRLQLSLTQVGSQLPSWPQLGNAAIVSGAAASYVARRILTGQPMPSGRYEIHLDAALEPDYHSEQSRSQRARAKADFIEGFELLFGE